MLWFREKKCCTCIATEVIQAKGAGYDKYFYLVLKLESLVKKGDLDLVCGSCDLNQTVRYFEQEKFYTLSHFLTCNTCARTFYVGACVRGSPVFEVDREIPPKEKLFNVYNGRVGSVFSS